MSKEFEEGLRKALQQYEETPKEKKQRRVAQRHTASKAAPGFVVRLAVRMKNLSMDTIFEHHSKSISKLQARIEAEQAARAEGWLIIGYVIDIKQENH